MTSTRWQQIRVIFDSAMDIPSAERATFLKKACPNDPELLTEVQRLLQEHDNSGDFLNQPVISTASLSDGEVLAKRYRISKLIGRGGMGEVYQARDLLLHEDVALKTLRADIARDESYLRRFNTEIHLARRVTHLNVCRVFEVGVHEFAGSARPPLRFFTMELLSGETLSARIQRCNRLSREEAFPIAVQMAEGLHAAHEAGIVHADFKSGNIILVPVPGGERAVITDFGLARIDPNSDTVIETRSLSLVGQVIGTVAYMSPEQMTGGIVTPSSDIYSFGIVLFEMATGQMPFDNQHLINAAVQRVSGEGPTARSLVPHLDSRWDAAISRCLQRDPLRRFATAADVADWFQDRAWWTRSRHWTRRDAIRAAVMAVVFFAIAIGLWVAMHQPYQPNQTALEWYAKGEDALHSMTFEAARKALEQSVAADPKFALAHASLAWAYDELDYSERAKESMLRAMTAAQEIRLSSQDETRLRALQFVVSREYDRAAPLFQRLEDEAAPQEKPAAILESGWLAQQREQTDVALAAFQRAVKLNPSYAAAKLRLGYVQGRRREVAAALKSFTEAAELYNAASEYEGLTETLRQRASFLNRSSREKEALPVIQKALGYAGTLGNFTQQIQLQLLEGVSIRKLGDSKRAGELAQKAIDEATNHRMENVATGGLIDLGNAFLAHGELEQVEHYYRQALELAKRSKARRNEARAYLSLASLYEQKKKPEQAGEFIQAALPFYRQAGYRKELVQATLILGRVHLLRAEFEEGVRILTDVLPTAQKLQDVQLEAIVRESLGQNLRALGAWPEALAQQEQAAKLQGAKSIVPRLDAAELYARLGREKEAEKGLSEVERILESNPNPNRLMLFDLRLKQAEFAYQEDRIPEARAFARQAAAVAPANADGEELGAQLMESLVLIRTRQVARGNQMAQDIIAKWDRANLILAASTARLMLSEALVASGNLSPALRDAARESSLQALAFFEPRKILEASWRAHLLVACTSPNPGEIESHRLAAASSLAQLRTSWSPGSVEGYLQRPDLKSLSATAQL
ncbi:MAG: protein kinase [Bryobacteraceae bacterium]